MTESKINSILAAECGNTTTTAALIELVDGHYRLAATGQAPSTYGAPWNDITVGVQNANRRIEETTGRTLLAPGGWPITPRQPNKQGVDAFVVVSSAGPPLAVALAGLMNNISLTSAHRAATTTYSQITTKLALDNEAGSRRSSVEAQIQALQADPPDVILLAGGTDGGAERPVIEMANAVLMALQVLPHTNKPDVLFAGNKDTRNQVVDIIGETANTMSGPPWTMKTCRPAKLNWKSSTCSGKCNTCPNLISCANGQISHPFRPAGLLRRRSSTWDSTII